MPLWFRLSLALLIVFNSFLTYLYERIGMWYLTLWWRKRIDKNRLMRQKKIAEDLSISRVIEMGGTSRAKTTGPSLFRKVEA